MILIIQRLFLILLSIGLNIHGADLSNSLEDDWVEVEKGVNKQFVKVLSLDGKESLIEVRHQDQIIEKTSSSWTDTVFWLADKVGEGITTLVAVPTAAVGGALGGAASTGSVAPLVANLIEIPMGGQFVLGSISSVITLPILSVLTTTGFVMGGTIAWYHGGKLYYVGKAVLKTTAKGTYWVLNEAAKDVYSMLPARSSAIQQDDKKLLALN